MATVDTFDPAAFTQAQREEWESAAAGWNRWHPVLEGETAGKVQTRTLLELAAIGPGDTVLDVATGCGEPGLSAARAVRPEGRVVCTDLSEQMLAFARRRAHEAGLDNIEFVAAAAEDLDFEPQTFDAILCRHGLQFVVDLPGTLQRLRTFLKPGGRLAAIVWGPPQQVQFSLAVPVILEELQLPPPPTGRPGIFALADADALSRLVTEAGFGEVATGTLEVIYEADSARDWTQLIRDISPPITNLVKGQPPDVQERVWQKVTEAWAPFATPDGSVRLTCLALWVAGTR